MKTIRIKFCDFWKYFNPENNYFYHLLSKKYDLKLSEDPEIVIYSSYGTEYLNYDCHRIFYTAENLRPDFSGCDFAITFDYIDNPRHLRLPLYLLYIDQYSNSLKKLLERKTCDEALSIWRSKKKFCCMVVSNPKSKTRINFFKKLSEYKSVDSGGLVLNNIGSPVKDKMSFIKDYRFVFAFENSAFPGYTTEKILQPFLVDSIPLYWGNPLIANDFNISSFLRLDNLKTQDSLIKKIIALEKDEKKAAKMLMEPKLKNPEMYNMNKQNLLKFFGEILSVQDTLKPVARTNKKYLHALNLKRKYYTEVIKEKTNKIFRYTE